VGDGSLTPHGTRLTSLNLAPCNDLASNLATMIQTDRFFLDQGPALVDPWDPTLVNPASLDLRMGVTALVLGSAHQPQPVDLASGYAHPPQQTLLLSTLETIRIPIDCAGIVRLKSSSARAGWRLAGAEFLDPGFEGIVTLSLSHGAHDPIGIQIGKRFAQLIVLRTEGIPIESYQGKYQGATQVQEAK
jgi:deoxycytidine triphosphate deaminase